MVFFKSCSLLSLHCNWPGSFHSMQKEYYDLTRFMLPSACSVSLGHYADAFSEAVSKRTAVTKALLSKLNSIYFVQYLFE